MPRTRKREAPDVGSVFVAHHKGGSYQMRVVTCGDKVGFQVGDRVFSTPSAAAQSVTGYATNGYLFWRMD